MRTKLVGYYTADDEKSRLSSKYSLERIRSQEIISRYIHTKDCKILDVGGASGIYSFWLASLGHSVDLIDLVPKHIDQAKEYEQKNNIQMASMRVGDACTLRQSMEFNMGLLRIPSSGLL